MKYVDSSEGYVASSISRTEKRGEEKGNNCNMREAKHTKTRSFVQTEYHFA